MSRVTAKSLQAMRNDLLCLLSGQLNTEEAYLEIIDELMFIDEILWCWRR